MILLHGWPEFWYSWRNQLPVLEVWPETRFSPSRRFLNVDCRCNSGFLNCITDTIMPHKTIIRLPGVARNPANGFPARPLGRPLLYPKRCLQRREDPMQHRPPPCPGCSKELRYGSHCRKGEDELPHRPWRDAPYGKCMAFRPDF